MMFVVSPLLALIALITVPVSVLVTAVIGKRSQKLFVKQWKSTGELNAHIEEAFTGHSLVKVFGRRREVEAVFAERNQVLYSSAFGAQFVSGIIMPAMFFIGNLNYVVIAVIGGLQVASGTMNLGSVQAFIQYSRMFTQPLTQVASMANILQSGVASAERVFEVLDAEEQSAEATGELNCTRGKVVFDHVSFSYEPSRPLITDLSLEVDPGQTVAIVGPTGAGKTTLVNLIMRFYELRAGRISARRRGHRECAPVAAAVPDRHGAAGRLAVPRHDRGEHRVRAARRQPGGDPGGGGSHVRRPVRALAARRVRHRDRRRGQQHQRGGEAADHHRPGVPRRPGLLILDEATSSVDTRTEVLVQRAMAALRTDRTSFVIAHRLSTIRDADVILVMEDGAIVEQGDHYELLAARGAYWALYQSQFAAAIEDEETGALTAARGH